jgi:hypothetical protein
LNLSRQTGNDPPLVGLLRVFKDYYPEIIVGEAVRGKASAFKVGFSVAVRVQSLILVNASTPTFSGARDWERFKMPIGIVLRSRDRQGLRAVSELIDLSTGLNGARLFPLC